MKDESSLEMMKKRIGWNTLSAVSHGRVFNDIDSDVLLRPGPRTIEAVRLLHERLYR